MIIELLDDFFIDIDSMENYTLKQRYIGKTKDGVEKEYVKEISYHPNIQSCIRKMAFLMDFDKHEKDIVSLSALAKSVDETYKRILATEFKVSDK